MPRVSIILPVYNAAATLERCLQSIRHQTFTDYEVLIGNDGSTDATAIILNEAAANDSRIRIFNCEINKGIVYTLNALCAASQSPLLARMDADDEMFPHRLQLQVEHLDQFPEIGLVGCKVEFGGDRQEQAGYANYVNWLNGIDSPTSIRLNRFVESPFAHPSVLFRRSLLDQFGAYRNGNFPEDYELWLRWINADVKMDKLPFTLMAWHDHPKRLSRIDARYASDRFHEIKAFYLAAELRRCLNNRPLWLCGAGRVTRRRSNFLKVHQIAIAGYVDVDPKKLGTTTGDKPVLSLTDLSDPSTAFVVSYITNRGARDEIRNALKQKGFREGADFLLAG